MAVPSATRIPPGRRIPRRIKPDVAAPAKTGSPRSTTKASRTVTKQKKLQRDVEEKSPPPKQAPRSAVQAGARKHPVKMPAHHLPKPATEHALQPAPGYSSPAYRGRGTLA